MTTTDLAPAAPSASALAAVAMVQPRPTDCPFRATCRSPVCRGDWTAPACPGARKED